MKKFISALLAVSTTVAMSQTALAQNASDKFEFNGNFGFVSDYRWRGTSLSNNNMAIQGGFSANRGGFYGGAWASNFAGLGNLDTLELDIYAGYGLKLSEGLKLDLGGKYVAFPGVDNSSFFRVSGSLSADVGGGSVGVGIDYEPQQNDTFLDGGDNHYIYAKANYPLSDSGFSLSARVGREDGQFADDKIDWLLGVSKELAGLNWSLQYVDTNKDGDGNSATAVLGVSKGF